MISTAMGNTQPYNHWYSYSPQLETSLDRSDFLYSQFGLSAEEFAHLAVHHGILPADLAAWFFSTVVDQSEVEAKDARELNERCNTLFEQITESPLFKLPSLLSKFLNKTVSAVGSVFTALEKDGKHIAEGNKAMLGQFEKTLSLADAVLPITMCSDIFALYKQISKLKSYSRSDEAGAKAKLFWGYFKASATGASILSKTLRWPEAIAKAIGQFVPDLVPGIKTSKELFGLNMAGHGFSLIAGILSVAKQWGEARKAIDYGEAALGTMGIVGNVIDLPGAIVKKLVLINPAIETASKVASWAPWLGVVSVVLSTTSIAAAGCSMGKSLRFAKRLGRARQEGVIKYLSRSQGHQLYEGPAKEQFNKAIACVEHHEAALLLKQMIAGLDKASDDDSLGKAYETLISNIGLMRDSGYCGSEIASLMEQQSFLQSSSAFASNPSFRASLKEILGEELERVRKVKNSYDFTALMRDIQVEIDSFGAPLLQQLAKVANEGYIDKLIRADEKTLEYHFNLSGEGENLRESLKRISQISKNSRAIGIEEGVSDIVDTLKGRAKQKIAGDIWTLVTSIVSLVAAIILTIVAFGLSCSPLAPLAYALMVAVALASVSKILCDYLQKNKFKETFTAIENKIYEIEAIRQEELLVKAQFREQLEEKKLQALQVHESRFQLVPQLGGGHCMGG